MNFKKISAILVGVMVLSVLGGCGSKDKTPVAEMESKYSKYVKLGQYEGVEYVPTKTEITDEDIENEKSYLISMNTARHEIKEGIATMGDTVNIDFTGYIDGEVFDGGSTNGAGTDVELGSGSMIDDFEEQIAGHSPGDAFDIEVTFPDDYYEESYAGKDALFETVLNYIVESEEPVYNDALIASATDYKTVAEYEEATRKELEQNASESDASTDRMNIMETVINNCEVTEYPEEELKSRISQITDNMAEQAETNGVDLETYLSYYGYDADSFQTLVKENVENYLKEKMIVVTIAEKVGIEVSAEEVDLKVQEYLESSGISDKETFMKTYGYEEEDLYYEILYTKVGDYILEKAVPVAATNTDATEETTEE